MRIIFRSVAFLITAASTALVGCSIGKPVEEVKFTPHLPPVKIEMLEKYITEEVCNTPETDLPSLEEASRHLIQIEAQTESQDYENVDCQGKVLESGHKAITYLAKRIQISADLQFDQEVSRITVENFRTCRTGKIDANESELKPLPEDDKIPTADILLMSSKATRKGDLELSLTNFSWKNIRPINISEGKNVLEFKYFGKCLKLEEAKDNSAAKCLEAEELGRKTVLVEFQNHVTKLPGKRTFDLCTRSR